MILHGCTEIQNFSCNTRRDIYLQAPMYVLFITETQNQWNTKPFDCESMICDVPIALVTFSCAKITCYLDMWRHVFMQTHLVFHWRIYFFFVIDSVYLPMVSLLTSFIVLYICRHIFLLQFFSEILQCALFSGRFWSVQILESKLQNERF